jgi:capsular exopolysaccharide synthesis family protein
MNNQIDPNQSSNYYPNPGSGNGDSFTSADFSHIIGKVLKNWHWLAGSAAICLGVAFYYLQTQTRLYQVDASLYLSFDKENATGAGGFMKEAGYFESISQLEDEIGILTSYPLISQSLDDLDYGIIYSQKDGFRKKELTEQDSPFRIVLDSSHIQVANVNFELTLNEIGEIQVALDQPKIWLYDTEKRKEVGVKENVSWSQWVYWGDTVESPFFRFVIEKNEDWLSNLEDKYYFQVKSEYFLVSSFKSSLKVKPANDEGKIVNLSIVGATIDKEMAFLEKLIENYINQDLDEKQKIGRKTIDFIDDQIDSVGQTLKSAENKLSSFRSFNEVVDPGTAAKGMQSQIEAFEEKILNSEMKLGYYNYLKSTLNSRKDASIPVPSAEEINDPLLRALLEDLSRMTKEKTTLGFNTTKANPQYKLLEEQIENVRTSILASINNQITTQTIKHDELEANYNRLRAKLNQLPVYEKGLNKIEREFNTVNEQYQYLQEKRAEAGIALANQTVYHKIIDPPHLTSRKPVSPNTLMILGLALAIGLGLPILAIFGLDFFNNKIVTQKDIRMTTSIPIGGFISQNDTQDKLIHQGNLQTLFAESFRSLRVRLRYLNKGTPSKVIGITSGLSGEGKSFCSANLSCVMGMIGEKTLLIDLDFRKPTQQSYFEDLGFVGLSHYLMDECEKDEIFYPSHISGLTILPVGATHYNPLDLFDTEKFADLMREVREEYDQVIIDTPPIGRTSDYLMLNQWIDQTLYVVRHKYTRTHSFAEINELYELGKIDNISLLINCVTSKHYFQYGEAGLYGRPKDHYGKIYGNAKV